ncbi:MAG: hypothetical protein NVS3B10_10430 [Polyangiales bacterium]
MAASSSLTSLTSSSFDKRPFLGTVVSVLLVALWAALAAGVVLTVIFPERSVSLTSRP